MLDRGSILRSIVRKERRERKGKHLREQQQRRGDADIANDEPAETCQQTKADKEAETVLFFIRVQHLPFSNDVVARKIKRLTRKLVRQAALRA